MHCSMSGPNFSTDRGSEGSVELTMLDRIAKPKYDGDIVNAIFKR